MMSKPEEEKDVHTDFVHEIKFCSSLGKREFIREESL